jgi:hypothetical protein
VIAARSWVTLDQSVGGRFGYTPDPEGARAFLAELGDKTQLAALLLVMFQNLLMVVCLHAVAYWIFPRLGSPISEPPEALRALVSLDPL